MRMQWGRHIKQMLEVATKIPGWHTFDENHKLTASAVRRLNRAGYIEVRDNKYQLKKKD